MRLAENIPELRHCLRSIAEIIDVLVVPSFVPDGEGALTLIREVAISRPNTAIVAYCQAGTQFTSNIRSLAIAGVHQFLFAGVDDVGVSLRTVLSAARRQCAAECVLRQLALVLPPMLLPIAEIALAKPEVIVDTTGLAEALGMHRKTLIARCAKSHFIGPAELLRWTRLALVAHLLETTGCAISRIAIELSFPSDTALRNLLKRYTGVRASSLRAAGGVDFVIQCLDRRVQASASASGVSHGVTLPRMP